MKEIMKKITGLASLGAALFGLALNVQAGPGGGFSAFAITNLALAASTTNVFTTVTTVTNTINGGTNNIYLQTTLGNSLILPYNAEGQLEFYGWALTTNTCTAKIVLARLGQGAYGTMIETYPLTTNIAYISLQGAGATNITTNIFDCWFQLPRTTFGQANGLGVYSISVDNTDAGAAVPVAITNWGIGAWIKNLYFPN